MADGLKCLVFFTVLLTPLASAYRPIKQNDKMADVSKFGRKKCGGINIPPVRVNIPDVDVNVPGVDVDVPGVDVNVTGVGVNVPGFNIPGVGVPGLNIPGVEIGIPEVSIGGGRVQVGDRCGGGGCDGRYMGTEPGMPGWGWRQNQMEMKPTLSGERGHDHKVAN